MTRKRAAHWLRILAASVIAALVVLFVFGGVTWRTRPSAIARGFAVSFVFSLCIGLIASTAMPKIAPWIWRRTRFPMNWVALSVAMMLLAIVGSIAAITVLMAVGVARPGQFVDWFQGSLRISLVMTLTIGLFITAYEVMRARVAQSSAEAQLASLESRVQPHFLFNTLNSIAALIPEDPKSAERMTSQLASLMRSSLDQHATPLVALEDELKIVRDYLAIEQVRFGDRLRYDIRIADGMDGIRVPRLALQTVVENSVKYAVSPRREGASIRVFAARDDAKPPAVRKTTIVVEDDGPGFDASVLPAGHGLALLRDRLALLFPAGASLRVDSAPGRTAVTLTFPETHDRPNLAVRLRPFTGPHPPACHAPDAETR